MLFCADAVPVGEGIPTYVPNNNDSEPYCITNDSDECGECQGSCNTEPLIE